MTDARSEARAYATIRYRLLLIDLALGALLLIVFQSAGFSALLASWCRLATPSEPLIILGYLAGFGLVHYVVTFPLHWYGSFRVEHQFGLSRLTLNGWVIRELKHVAVGSIIGLILVEGGYAMLRASPAHWPIWATVGWVGVSVVLARIFPTVLLPIFYKTTRLPDEALVQRLSALCQRVGLPVLGVFRFQLGAETRKANAALAGLGKTRRVLLADTLIEEFPPDEIEGVLAHELAHHRFHHIAKTLMLSAVGSWVAFALTQQAAHLWVDRLGLQSLADITGFPMLALWLSLLGLISLPLHNGLSRFFEWQADHFAVQTTPPAAFVAALRRLGALNLADPNPPRWITWMFYDHPPITDRIRAAEHTAGD